MRPGLAWRLALRGMVALLAACAREEHGGDAGSPSPGGATARQPVSSISPATAVAAPESLVPPTSSPLAANPAHLPGVIARLDGRDITLQDVAPDVAFQVYQRQVDIHSLLRSRAEEVADRLLLERAAAAEGASVDDLLRREVDAQVKPMTDADVDAWLAEHPRDAAIGDAARPRVRFYLEERQRIERRLALLERLRAAARYEFLVPPPVEPRVRVDVAGAPSRGPADAPVTIVHFASFASPLSARSAQALHAVQAENPGEVRVVHRSFLDTEDEVGVLAAQLAIAVARDHPDRFWELHDRLFAESGRLTEEKVAEIAAEIGVPPARLAEIRGDPAILAALRDDVAIGQRAGVPREPAAFVNGRYVSGTFGDDRLRLVVREELGRVPSQADAAAPSPSRTRTRTPSAIASPG